MLAARPPLSSPCEGEVHQAEHGACQQRDGVRPVEELYCDILHLLFVDHSKMHPVVDVILAQGMRAPVRGRHGWRRSPLTRSLAGWMAPHSGVGRAILGVSSRKHRDPQYESGEGEEEEVMVDEEEEEEGGKSSSL